MLIQIGENLRILRVGFSYSILEKRPMEKGKEKGVEKFVEYPNFSSGSLEHTIKKVCDIKQEKSIYKTYKEYEEKRVNIMQEILKKIEIIKEWFYGYF